MDLDASPRLNRKIRKLIPELLRRPVLRRELLALGIDDLDLSAGPNKDTETAYRHKLSIVAGGVAYPTKIEVSYRSEAPASWADLAEPLPVAYAPYLASGSTYPAIARYGRDVAVWQKIVALARRSRLRARDVFDLGMLGESRHDSTYGPIDLNFLRVQIADEILREAGGRALAMTHEQFRAEVHPYLIPAAQARYEAEWETIQLGVASFIETAERTTVSKGRRPAEPRAGEPQRMRR